MHTHSAKRRAKAPPVRPHLGERTILLSVNGEQHHLKVEPGTTLLDLLRDDLRLIGAPERCEGSRCDACMVIVDRRLVDACRMPAMALDGAEVTTIERLKAAGGTDGATR